VAARRTTGGSFSDRRPGMTARHVGASAGLVEEDQPALLLCKADEIRLRASPLRARFGHVRPLLLAGVHGFF